MEVTAAIHRVKPNGGRAAQASQERKRDLLGLITDSHDLQFMFGMSSWRHKYQEQERALIRDCGGGDGERTCIICNEEFEAVVKRSGRKRAHVRSWVDLYTCGECENKNSGREAAWQFLKDDISKFTFDLLVRDFAWCFCILLMIISIGRLQGSTQQDVLPRWL
jgi:hypothetical protein